MEGPSEFCLKPLTELAPPARIAVIRRRPDLEVVPVRVTQADADAQKFLEDWVVVEELAVEPNVADVDFPRCWETPCNVMFQKRPQLGRVGEASRGGPTTGEGDTGERGRVVSKSISDRAFRDGKDTRRMMSDQPRIRANRKFHWMLRPRLCVAVVGRSRVGSRFFVRTLNTSTACRAGHDAHVVAPNDRYARSAKLRRRRSCPERSGGATLLPCKTDIDGCPLKESIDPRRDSWRVQSG